METLATVILESVTLSSGKTHTRALTHSAAKISTNPVYYLPPSKLCLSFSFDLPLSFSPSLPSSCVSRICPPQDYCSRVHTHTHTHTQKRTHSFWILCTHAHTLSVFSCDVCWPGAETRKREGERCCALLSSSAGSVHVLQGELLSLCVCEGAAALTICAVDAVAGARVCVCERVLVCACVCFSNPIIF